MSDARASGRMPYLPALDGIRALAVAAVVLYHAGVFWLPAGFLGVDVFFVVSGFLITALLVAEFEREQRVDLRAFWIRRARRLLPALALVLAVTTVYAVVVLGDQLVTHLREVLAATVYVTNWDLIIRDISYFESFDRPSQLRHLWSLAVEEQFYLLWPIVFALLTRFVSKRAVLVIVVLLGAASLAWMVALYQPGEDPSRVYFGSDPRAFTILLGVALGLVWRPWRWSWPEQKAWLGGALDVVGLGGLGAMAGIMLYAHWWDAWLYPWGLLGVSLGAAALIAAVVRHASAIAPLLGLSPLRWLGLRSYGVYLWHWPVLIALTWEFDFVGWQLLALGVAITAGLSEASYRWLETPVRRGVFWAQLGWRPPPLPGRAWASVAAVALVAAAAGLVLIDSGQTSSALERTATAAVDSDREDAPRGGSTDAVLQQASAGEVRFETEPTEAGEAEALASFGAASDTARSPASFSQPAVRSSSASASGSASASVSDPASDRADDAPSSEAASAPDIESPTSAEAGSTDDPDDPSEGAVETVPSSDGDSSFGALDPTESGAPNAISYVVRPGDTPIGIARQFGTTLDELVERNGDGILTSLYAKDVLEIPCPNAEPCAIVEITSADPGCVRWENAQDSGRSCSWERMLMALPATFTVERGPFDAPASWEWGGAVANGDTVELTVANAAGRFDQLVVRFGARPLAIGDSVMYYATRALRTAGVEVDAEGARSANESIHVLARGLRTKQREVVIFQGIGYQFLTTEDFTRLIDAAADVEHLIVLTRQFPPRNPWIRLEHEGNEMLRREAPKHANVTLIDWNAITDGREDELTTDGTHLSELGLELYVETIVEAIRAGPGSARR